MVFLYLFSAAHKKLAESFTEEKFTGDMRVLEAQWFRKIGRLLSKSKLNLLCLYWSFKSAALEFALNQRLKSKQQILPQIKWFLVGNAAPMGLPEALCPVLSLDPQFVVLVTMFW